MRKARLASAMILWCATGSAAMAHHVVAPGPSNAAGSINTISPDGPGAGELAFNTEFYAENYRAFSDEELTEFAEAGLDGVHNTDAAYLATLSLLYGVSDRLGLSLAIPFVVRTGVREVGHHDDTDDHAAHPEIAQLGSSEGLGDLQIDAKYTVLDRNTNGFGLALIAGLSVPTGKKTERTNEGSRFETEFQPGSGSWDPRFGLAVGKSLGPFSADANLLYTLRTEGSQDTNRGDHLAFNAGLSWRIGKGSHTHDDGVFERHEALDLIVEFNGEWEERERVGNFRDPHSGGTQIFVSPGARYSSANGWTIYSSVGIPIHENLRGTQNDTDIRFKLGVGLVL